MKLKGDPFVNSSSCKGIGYAKNGASMDIAKIELTGRYPEYGWVMNEISYELAYVLQGGGTFITSDEGVVEVGKGDVVSIVTGKKYAWEGVMTLVVACNPPFDSTQHKLVEEK